MSYEARDQQKLRDEEYQNLKRQKESLQVQVANWVDKATSLHTDSPTQEDKDEIIAQRNAFVAALQATLGV
jgi:hypothetical protein